MELHLLCHLARIARFNEKSGESWLEVPTLLCSSLLIVEKLLEREYVNYYATFEYDLCITQLFQDQ
jgi:hypothetical protein